MAQLSSLLPLGSVEGQALTNTVEGEGQGSWLVGPLSPADKRPRSWFVIEATEKGGHIAFFVPFQLSCGHQLAPSALSPALVAVVTMAVQVRWAWHPNQNLWDMGNHGSRPVLSSQTHTANVAMLKQDMPNYVSFYSK